MRRLVPRLGTLRLFAPQAGRVSDRYRDGHAPVPYGVSGRRFRRGTLAIGTILFLALPAVAVAASDTTGDEEKFNPASEWTLHEWVPIHLGPIDMSINKAVAYLMLGALVSCLIGILFMRVKVGKDPDRKQAVGETIYEVAQVQVAEQGLPTKAIGLWFPYVATLMIFIWVVNMLGFIPLPLSDEKVEIAGVNVPTLAIFAATSTLSVTLALAFMTWMFTHIEGIRHNGVMKYLQSWIPDVPKVLYPLIIPLEILGQFMRLISLSVRLYANMLAGHMLILTFIGLIFLVTPWIFPFSVLLASVFYVFEVVIVVSIQAYIFAALSAIYIGSAIEPEH
jgi:F-type H+-transporting ATPase subunit a